MRKEYLGDSVYASISEWGELILTTENGARPSNVIVMDGSVLAALEIYLEQARKEKK